MAGFKTHVTTSSVLGVAYAAAGYLHGFPPDTALVAGAMCGFGGMLPDLDSDYGTPLKETMCFTSATVPMLLLDRASSLGLRHDQMVLLAVSIYLFMRFGLTNMIRKYTVHRGMFHSVPAMLTFAGAAFLICGSSNLDIRYFKSGGVMLGVFSHLLLDEIWAIEFKGGRWRLKKSFGTAIKFWGDDGWANFSCYAKLLAVGAMIVGEPSVMKQLQANQPGLAQTFQNIQTEARNFAGNLPSLPNSPMQANAGATQQQLPWDQQQPAAPMSNQNNQQPQPQPQYDPWNNTAPPSNAGGPYYPSQSQAPATIDNSGNNGWDTAQRPPDRYPQ